MTARAGDAALRSRLRAARRALAPARRAAADARIRAHVRALPAFRSAHRVAAFLAFDGEPDLSSLLGARGRKQFFVPVIAGGEMVFAAIEPTTELIANDFGILEPARPALIDPRSLDLVLTPLVGFDGHGNRLGVGAGYYDHCFRFLLNRRRWLKPKLVGTAYAVQQIERLAAKAWDVPLWGAVTEDGFQGFHR